MHIRFTENMKGTVYFRGCFQRHLWTKAPQFEELVNCRFCV